MSTCRELCAAWRKFLYIGLHVDKWRFSTWNSAQHSELDTQWWNAFRLLTSLKIAFWRETFCKKSKSVPPLCVGLHVKQCLHAWHSHRQSCSHFAFHHFQNNERYNLFSFFETLFVHNCRFLDRGDQKISWCRICRWWAVKLEIHLCSSGKNSDCMWRLTSLQFVEI